MNKCIVLLLLLLLLSIININGYFLVRNNSEMRLDCFKIDIPIARTVLFARKLEVSSGVLRNRHVQSPLQQLYIFGLQLVHELQGTTGQGGGEVAVIHGKIVDIFGSQEAGTDKDLVPISPMNLHRALRIGQQAPEVYVRIHAAFWLKLQYHEKETHVAVNVLRAAYSV